MSHWIKGALLWGGLVVATFVAGCSCSSSSSPPVPTPTSTPIPVFTPYPVLVPGTKLGYIGTYSETITVTSDPSENSVGDYTTKEIQKVYTAPVSAPAPFRVYQVLEYTVVKEPTAGIQPTERIVDSWENSTTTSHSQTLSLAQAFTRQHGIDITAGKVEGNGPYDYIDRNRTTYSSPRTLLHFPLVGGTSAKRPLGSTADDFSKSENSSGDIYALRKTTADFADDGGYTLTGKIAVGTSTTVDAKADGTATVVNTGEHPLKETIGLPVKQASGEYKIPVTKTVKGKTTKYLADDWYPGNALPPHPLAENLQKVIGPISLPSECKVQVPVTGLQEVDNDSGRVDVVAGTITTGKNQLFLAANGIDACLITTTTTLKYDVTTGAATGSIVDEFVQWLVLEKIP